MAHIRMKSFSYDTVGVALQVIFTVSKTYTIPAGYKSMDVFLVGGGSAGGYGMLSWATYPYRRLSSIAGGLGGTSGKTKTSKNIDVNLRSTISVNIGAGGVGRTSPGRLGKQTSIVYNGSTTITCDGGGGVSASSAGGSGGGQNSKRIFTQEAFDKFQYSTPGASNGANAYSQGQGTTTKAFEETNGVLYAGGGGGGCCQSSMDGSAGGAGGGGRGGMLSDLTSSQWVKGQPGTANTGGGGGGDGMNGLVEPSVPSDSGASGGSGIAIIRLYPNNKRPDITWNSKNTITINS